jgi:hypothetical protein
VAEEFDRLLRVLGNSALSQIAVWKLEGYTNAEIAAKTDWSEPTVEWNLRLIRQTW